MLKKLTSTAKHKESVLSIQIAMFAKCDFHSFHQMALSSVELFLFYIHRTFSCADEISSILSCGHLMQFNCDILESPTIVQSRCLGFSKKKYVTKI